MADDDEPGDVPFDERPLKDTVATNTSTNQPAETKTSTDLKKETDKTDGDKGETTNTPVVKGDQEDREIPHEAEGGDTFQQTVSSACNQNYILNKTAKVFRDRFTTLWIFWVDSLLGSTKNTYSIYNEKGENGFVTEQVSDEESVLFFTTTHDGSLHLVSDGILDNHTYWAVYPGGARNDVLKPIVGAKYFDISYNPVTSSVDLVFWANVNKSIFEATVDHSTVYPDELVDQVSSSGAVNTNAQRVLFYSRGITREVVETRTGKDRLREMFIFSKPIMLRNPGVSDTSSSADVVLDIVPNTTSFVEFA